MKSPLSTAALELEELQKYVGHEVAFVDFDANGDLTSDITFATMNTLKITSIEDGAIVGETLLGRTTWPFREFGIVPDSSGTWGRRCVVPLAVALELKDSWKSEHRWSANYQALSIPGGFSPRH